MGPFTLLFLFEVELIPPEKWRCGERKITFLNASEEQKYVKKKRKLTKLKLERII